MEKITESLEETEKLAQLFLNDLNKSLLNNDGALVVAMHGDLGSGKTSFVKGAAKFFGIKNHITSPTFVIEKDYDIEKGKFKKMVHIDAYRFENPKEMKVLNWEGILKDSGNIVFVEWAEKVNEFLPNKHMEISFEFIDEHRRKIIIKK